MLAQVHESLASRAASPLERAEDCGELVARMLHYQQVHPHDEDLIAEC